MDMIADVKEERKTIQCSATAHAAFEKVCKERAVERSMFSAATRLILWFAKQEAAVQAAVLADTDEGMEIPYAEALERLARDLREKARLREQVSRLPPDDSTTATGEGEPGNNPRPTPRGGFDPAAEVKPHWGRKKKG